MALLQNLADEFLSEIFSYLIGDKLLLCFVASQSKRLSELVRPLLARHVRFITRPPSKSYQLFVRSVTESSLFASMVQDVILTWGQCTPATHDLNNKLLERLPQLRSLKIEAFWDDLRWKHDFLKKNPMKFLTKVNLKIPYLSIADVVKYVFLRRLKCLSILYISRPKVPKLPRNRSYGDSNIVCLKLESGFHLPEDVLNEMLRYPRGLKTLITNLPGCEIPDNDFIPGCKLTTPLSPVAVMRALEPTKRSLVDLSLVDENCIWPSHDRSRTDLSDFTAIKKLHISSLCYFLPGNSERNGIVHLLPASLEEIEIVYALGSAISPVPRAHEAAQLYSNASGDMTPHCNWMLDLANAKGSGRLPALNKVALTECGWNRWNHVNQRYMISDWNIPTVVMKAFCQAGIELIASARTGNVLPYVRCRYEPPLQEVQDHEFYIIYQRP